MPGYISYDGIPCQCGHCGAKDSEDDVNTHILWSNQHGTGLRVFCHECGYWTDWKRTDSAGLTSRVYLPAKKVNA